MMTWIKQRWRARCIEEGHGHSQRRWPVIWHENPWLYSISAVKISSFISQIRRFSTDSPKIPFCVQMRASVLKLDYNAVNRGLGAFLRPETCSDASLEQIWLFTVMNFVNYINSCQLTFAWFIAKVHASWKHVCDAVITAFPHVHMKSCGRL